MNLKYNDNTNKFNKNYKKYFKTNDIILLTILFYRQMLNFTN